MYVNFTTLMLNIKNLDRKKFQALPSTSNGRHLSFISDFVVVPLQTDAIEAMTQIDVIH